MLAQNLLVVCAMPRSQAWILVFSRKQERAVTTRQL